MSSHCPVQRRGCEITAGIDAFEIDRLGLIDGQRAIGQRAIGQRAIGRRCLKQTRHDREERSSFRRF